MKDIHTEHDSEAYISQLIEYLNLHRSIWEKEVLQDYPSSNEKYDTDFLLHLANESPETQYEFTKNAYLLPVDRLPQYIVELEKHIHTFNTEISSRYTPSDITELPIHSFQNVKEKKRHELINIFGLLKNEGKIPSENIIVDYCGGAAYLARNLAYYFNTQTISVDIDNTLQERGKEKSRKYIPHGATEYDTLHADLTKECNVMLPDESPSIILHACGNLLDAAILNSINRSASWILAIGCCYYKMRNPMFPDYGSTISFEFSPESLVLASRGHDQNLSSFYFSQQVKKYRYLLHILLHTHLKVECPSVGECKKVMYMSSFSTYANNRIQTIFGDSFAAQSKEAILEIENNKSSQNEVLLLLAKNLIRSKFSRLLEIVIALERKRQLQSYGYDVRIFQLFNTYISQRNIALWATRPDT